MNKIISVIIALFITVVLAFSIKGYEGNPTVTELNTNKWKFNGPFELSPERGRFALTYSLIENKSVYLSPSLANFAIPDVGFLNKDYVSLFAPGVSVIVIPGYMLGKLLGASQIGTYFIISLFALANVLLIKKIAELLGADSLAGLIGGVIFIFGTPAFTYAGNLYQHHISVFLILMNLYIVISKNRSILWSFLFWFLTAVAVTVDYPNFFLMFPICVWMIFKSINIALIADRLKVKINLLLIFTVISMIIPLGLFMYFNYLSYGNPLRLSGTVPTVSKVDENGQPLFYDSAAQVNINLEELSQLKPGSAGAFFATRNMLNGLYIHLFSQDRGIIIYAPIILIGIIAYYFIYKKKTEFFSLLVIIPLVNLILYSMWGDPWGGWAFGSRYLIPTYAILSICITLLLTYYKKHIWVLALFLLISYYSIGVNALGAITTSAIPPKVQVLQLEELSGVVQKYTFMRNWDFLTAGHSKSFGYNKLLKNVITPYKFYIVYTSSIVIFLTSLTIYYAVTAKKGDSNV